MGRLPHPDAAKINRRPRQDWEALFAKHDVNGDGRICRDDLFHILEKVTLMEEKLEKKKKKKKKKKDDDDSDDDSDSDSEEEKEDPRSCTRYQPSCRTPASASPSALHSRRTKALPCLPKATAATSPSAARSTPTWA